VNKARAQREGHGDLTKDNVEELKRLRAEVAELRMERDVALDVEIVLATLGKVLNREGISAEGEATMTGSRAVPLPPRRTPSPSSPDRRTALPRAWERVWRRCGTGLPRSIHGRFRLRMTSA